MTTLAYKAVVMGASAGGMQALKTIIAALPSSFPLPVAVVQHIGEHRESILADYLSRLSALSVKEAEDKEPFCAGQVYLAPPGYHLLIEPDKTFSLSVDPCVNYSCPSIDVLFESAADAFGNSLIGVVLTGANADGSHGLKAIKANGGLVIVQNPETAEARAMPQAAARAVQTDYIVELEKVAPLLVQLSAAHQGGEHGSSACN